VLCAMCYVLCDGATTSGRRHFFLASLGTTGFLPRFLYLVLSELRKVEGGAVDWGVVIF
jgi:hypothetical protein